MAIALIGEAAFGNITTGATSFASAATTFSGGELAVLCCGSRDGDYSLTGVAGDGNNSTGWALAGTVEDGAGTWNLEIWYKANCAASTNEVITASLSGTTRSYLNLSRWSGAALTSALDQTDGTNSAGGLTTHPFGSITTTGAGLIIAALYHDGSSVTAATTDYTALSKITDGRLFAQYKISTGAETAAPTVDTGSSTYSSGKIVNFLEAAAGDPEGSLIQGKLLRGGLLLGGVLTR